MAGPHRRRRPVLGLVVVLSLALGWIAVPRPAQAASAWDGGMNLYRPGVFTTQKSWLWCTAAGVQIIRNIVDRDNDHSKANQRRYFRWMRRHNRYDLPLSAGVDPQGWAAGLRHYVDKRYKLVATTSFDRALRLAVIRMRKTNLPVALTVSRGNHGWVLHGFRATADPLTTDDFTVTSVRVTGPLYGLQSRSFGYDMKPNKKLTTAQLKRFFTRWRYAPRRMIWDGKYVSIQPVTPRAAASTSGATADASTSSLEPVATPVVQVVPSMSPASQPSPTATSSVEPSPSTAVAAASISTAPPDATSATTRAPPEQGPGPPALAAVLTIGLLIAGVLVLGPMRRARRVGPAP
jgi:hypothetical protein